VYPTIFPSGGGFDVILPFAGEIPILFLTPKVGYKISEKWHLGGGLLLGYLSEAGVAGIGYGVSTFGNTDHNLTAGLGSGYPTSILWLNSNPVVNYPDAVNRFLILVHLT
jgi:hypothetical protein